MSAPHYYTDDERAALLSNPYTARLTDCHIVFTLAFKKFVMENIDKPGMTSRKVFRMAGYDDHLVSNDVRKYTVKQIRKEAQSPGGLKEPRILPKSKAKKKHQATEVKELQNRVEILEQQIRFLKKSLFVRDPTHQMPPSSSG